MEKVVIKYEKYTDLELLQIWNKDEYEYKMFLKETGLTDKQVEECIANEECITIIDEIIEYAEDCGLKYCTQCNCFVDDFGFINSAEQCVDCAIGNWV